VTAQRPRAEFQPDFRSRARGQTTNVNGRPDGGADVQVGDPAVQGDVVEETTTTTTTYRAP
jgi:hypothetical protein